MASWYDRLTQTQKDRLAKIGIADGKTVLDKYREKFDAAKGGAS